MKKVILRNLERFCRFIEDLADCGAQLLWELFGGYRKE